MIACSRCIDGNLNVLATALHIPVEEVKTIKSKFKTAQTSYQAFHLLKKWQSFGTHTKQELAEVLQGAGFPQATEMYVPCQTLVCVGFVFLVICKKDLTEHLFDPVV